MTRNDIKAQFPEATKEQIDAILNINSEDIGKVKSNLTNLENQVSQLNQQITTLNGQIVDKDKTINDLNTQVKDSANKNVNLDDLNKQIEQLKKDVADRDTTIANNSKQYRIKDELRGMKAKNVDVIWPLLKLDSITEKDGKLEGLAEQVEALQKSDSYLFDVDTDTNNQRGGFSGNQDLTNANRTNNDIINNAIRNAFRR